MNDGIDLRKLRFLPDSMTMPFRRVGLDPLPELAQVRAEAPVTRLTEMFGKGIWLVSGYDEARAALADSTSYSHDLRRFVSMEGRSESEQIGGLGMTDPPDHTVLRRYLTPEFTRHRLARLEPAIRAVVEARLDAMAAAGPVVDLVEQFAFPVPFQVICELLGLPVEDRADFLRLGVARFDLARGGVGVFGAAAHTREFLIRSVAAQRSDPGEGLIGALLREHGDELDDVTLGGLADGVFLGGYETSASMLALGTYLLTQHPEARDLLRSGDAAAAGVVEELLRHLSVVQVAFLRFARHDVELGGQRIAAGDVVGISLLGANRDDRLSSGADRFDAGRAPTRHLAFGHGIHRCVGAELARMELLIALRALVERFPDLTVAVAPSRLSFREVSAVYGLEALPVHLYGPPAEPAGAGPVPGRVL
jgi:cytochrome P450